MNRVPPARLSAAIFVLLAIVFAIGSFQLGFQQMGSPGPGLMTLLTSLLLLPLSVWLWLHPEILPQGEMRSSALIALGTLTLYALALPLAGFVLPTVGFVLLWAVVFYGRSLRSALGLGLALAIGAALLFHRFLGVQLPLWPGR